jgi:hypothetical protein
LHALEWAQGGAGRLAVDWARGIGQGHVAHQVFVDRLDVAAHGTLVTDQTRYFDAREMTDGGQRVRVQPS